MPNLLQIIRSRTRKGWGDLLRKKLMELRSWVQAHAERAAIGTFVLGVLIAVFFKFFILLVALGIILGYVIWYFAPAGDPQ